MFCTTRFSLSGRFDIAVPLLLALAPLAGLPAANAAPTKADYFVDADSGNDRQDGRSPATAWQSLERVNSAALQPGDTVRFRRGGVWRGSLIPASGTDDLPVTYTSYGEGAKPLILGSRPRHRPEDWVRAEDGIWATLPLEYTTAEPVLDLREGQWNHHQEQGAKLSLQREETPEGTLIRISCLASGNASNHLQIWGPALAVQKGTYLQLTLRARCSQSLRWPQFSLRQGNSPWTLCATAVPEDRAIDATWQTFQVIFPVLSSHPAARLHLSLGGILPAGAVLEIQPLSFRRAVANMPDPLSVDVGNIIFDHGKICGWKKWKREDLRQPYDYYYDRASQRVFLRAPANPATLHRSIELALARHVVNQSGKHHVIYDGLAILYGAAHGFGGGNTHHLAIRNCDLGYIGGAHQHTRPDGRPVRYGNAIEFWGAAHDNLVEGCHIWEVYDAALTNQGRDPSSRQINITYRNNFIRNAEYSFEYWNHPESAVTKNIRFVHNTCLEAGTVWSHAQRPDRNGSHLMFYSNTAATSDVEIKYNVFHQHTEWGTRYSSGWKTRPDVDCNLWYSTAGIMANWFGTRLPSFSEYQAQTGLEPRSVFARPVFVDEAHGDFRLAPRSPGAQLAPDRSPVGANLPPIEPRIWP